MTPLEKTIRHHIAMEGPMSIAEYMTLCLTHPEHGYYTSGTPVGGRGSAQREGGDFITAPEVSQMFGELIGVWCMEMWQAIGSPAAFNLVEFGPGRGTLMKDLLRVSKALPAFHNAAEVYLVEVSPTLAEQQSLALSASKSIHWVNAIEALPDRPTIAIGNEFLDALPFRQWCKNDGVWRERGIGLVNDELAFVLRPNTLAKPDLPPAHDQQVENSIFETAPAREAFVQNLAERLAKHGGLGLFVDYGYTRHEFGETFQAVRNHAFADPLQEPGKADLTSHVNFAQLLSVAKAAGCATPQATTQADFLLDLGLLERAGSLGAGKDEFAQNSLKQAVNRLAGADQMGKLFKVMAFGRAQIPPAGWPGFGPGTAN